MYLIYRNPKGFSMLFPGASQRSFYINYFPNFCKNLWMIAAASIRVALPEGSRRPVLLRPVMMPLATAQLIGTLK